MVEGEATIQNGAGIHCRPSAVIINELSGYGGKICVTADSGEADLQGLLDLLALGLQEGDDVTFTVDGPDEEQVAAQVKELLERHYDFPLQD